MPRKERRQLTKAELGRITSPNLVIRKVRPAKRREAGMNQKRKEGEQ